MKKPKPLALTLVAFAVASLASVPTDAHAQFRTRRDEWYGRPLPRSEDWIVRPSVVRAERQSNSFRAWFEKNYTRRHLYRDGEDRELKHDVQHLDEAMERLRKHASDGRPGIGREDLQDALENARIVDREIFRDRDTRFTYREWLDLRDTLNSLAHLYDVRGV